MPKTLIEKIKRLFKDKKPKKKSKRRLSGDWTEKSWQEYINSQEFNKRSK